MTPPNNEIKEVLPEGYVVDMPQAQAGAFQAPVQQQIDALTNLIQNLIKNHRHNGVMSPLNELNTDISGLFETVSSVPTNTPRGIFDQVKIYTNGTTYRLYWYDSTNHAWRYATGT